MKNFNLLFQFLLSAILCLSLYSCTADANNPVDTGGVIPNFDNDWHDINDLNHTFSFFQIDKGVNHGFFNGSEIYPDSNISGDILGVFTNNDLEFDSQRGAKTVRFVGSITSDTTMDVTYFGRKITLRKGNP